MSDIQITCHPQMDPQICRFDVTYDIYSGKKHNFKTKEEAKGSCLVEKLFAIEGIDQVYIDGNSLYITKNVLQPWPQFARNIGGAIRESIASGEPLISKDLEIKSEKELTGDDLVNKIQSVLNEQINPGIAMHGGRASLVEVKGNDVYVELSGGCQGCSMAMATLKNGIEATLKREIPSIEAVYDNTDHAQGQSPYFS